MSIKKRSWETWWCVSVMPVLRMRKQDSVGDGHFSQRRGPDFMVFCPALFSSQKGLTLW